MGTGGTRLPRAASPLSFVRNDFVFSSIIIYIPNNVMLIDGYIQRENFTSYGYALWLWPMAYA